MGKTIHQNRLKQKFIKISTKNGGSTMKIFGDDLNPLIPYKTFLLSVKDTTEWIIKEMLEKYGLKHENIQNYCLIQISIPPYNQIDNKLIQEIILHNKECPLNIYLNHLLQKNQGSIVFKVIKCSPEYIEIRQRLHTHDRIINDHRPFFVETNQDGTDLPTPRIFKLYPNTTYVGCDIKTDIGSQYFYIDGAGIISDHCILQNQNGIVTVIPHGEVWLDRKLVSTAFILQHRVLICFGRHSTFRYYDQKRKSILVEKKNNTIMYTSLPILPMNELPPEKLQKKISANDVVTRGTKFNVLPGLIEVPSETESRFLHIVFDNYPLDTIQFRLLPVYLLYMTIRYRLSPYRKLNLSLIEKQEDVITFLHAIEEMINKKIQKHQHHVGYLVYWLSNTSELIYFLKNDRDLSKLSHDIQIRLIRSSQYLFSYLINCLENELDKYLNAFFNPRDINTPMDLLKSTEIRWIMFDKMSDEYHQSTINDILAIFSSIIDLVRKCRINVELTIKIFSQLFYYINIWLFNRIISHTEFEFCSSNWGEKVLNRLKLINNWASKEGLELISESYLIKIKHLCLLLINPKRNLYDIDQIYQINSIQIKRILYNFILNENETSISKNFSQALLSIAYDHVDKNLHRQGLPIQLIEDSDLNIPFFLPEDGYTCEHLRGIPEQLFDFIEPMSRAGICRLFTNSYSFGLWTEFMEISDVNNKDIRRATIVLNRKANHLGLIIVSAKNESQQYQGIYIKGIVPNSIAEDNGQLQVGDQILSVNQISLINKTHEQATQILKQSGPSVTLQILKNAADHHGLSALFSSSVFPNQRKTEEIYLSPTRKLRRNKSK